MYDATAWHLPAERGWHGQASAAERLRKFVTFDFGGMLIDWNPRHLYRKLLSDEDSIEQFLSTVCARTERAAGCGRPWREAVAGSSNAAATRADRSVLASVAGNVGRTDRGNRRNCGRPAASRCAAGGLTNWSAETFPYARERFDFLNWFDGIVVSGEESNQTVTGDLQNFARAL